MTSKSATIKVGDVRFVKELYPRLKPHDDVIERYRDALDNLPPITVARDGVLVDGYHRWQAHVREGRAEIAAENLGNLADAEIVRESISRNASHGQQLTRADKKRLASQLWASFADFKAPDRVREICGLLAVSERSVHDWTKDARKAEKEAAQAKAWDLWLDCHSDVEIGKMMNITDKTANGYYSEFAQNCDFSEPPASRQHFDVWSFQNADKDAGQQSYFGALPPQVIENLLWLYTEPGHTVVDPFAGSGTTVDVAKAMGRRVWASDRIGNRYSPHLPIHEHDITTGWPAAAPRKADLILLDPPYWQQAKGRYSDDAADLANMSLDGFYKTWQQILAICAEHLTDAGRIAYIISPTQREDGTVVDHASDMIVAAHAIMPPITGLEVERRIIVPYQTQQATGQQVEWAREHRRLLKLYRDLVVMSR